MTITIKLLPSGDLGRALRALWPLALIALPAVVEAAGASLLVRLMLDITMRMADHAMSPRQA
ncbi:hypothetical protein AB0B89_31775 [Sphaerisporangium sp. NPDC049002]|uniref:hypothetical protein n=1 Tax=unclassified Sphaerisporangium TaxID=2630420 RepID=UPI0033E0631C